ncbi:phosphotransferase [Thalassotalea marina]|uniref:Phosphotransferase n=1 Tax=Thalassotalea marina TaxID=1673741 RepID=A0A919BPS9_9GAMM|nr:phosphotransferase [Thalassotalea marina]GHG01423.1 phosphotransferase [Thalassotalea marina]
MVDIINKLKHLLEDDSIALSHQVQSLWSGYGQILRIFSHKQAKHFIVKVVAPPDQVNHPRGWNSLVGHQRKLKSYQVEAHFYQEYAQSTDIYHKVPKLIASLNDREYTLLVMEDLDENGYDLRYDKGCWDTFTRAVKWLAYFHANFIGNDGQGLWPIGSYWHLATRQDEWQGMPESEYKTQASNIDNKLNQAQFLTLIHGDAKFANLCFQTAGDRVAAVDFQYVGKGVGVKDLAYLAGSCFSNQQLYQYDDQILDIYLSCLKEALIHYNKRIDMGALSQEYTELYPIAWADFYRFLLGWNPESWKVCHFMKEKSAQGLALL